jgi:glycosyltransferase involved in cell wall biosynthesis
MRILYLAHRVPYPPNKGDKLRAFRELEFLARRHEVWCACFVDDPRDRQYVEPLHEYCAGVAAIEVSKRGRLVAGLAGLLAGSTVTESFYRVRAMDGLLRRWSREVGFDAVVAFSSGMAPHALRVPAQRRVLDLCDLDSVKWHQYADRSRGPSRWIYRCEGRRLARREREWIDAFDAAVIISDDEAGSLDDAAQRDRLHVISNGVDVDRLLAEAREGGALNARKSNASKPGTAALTALDSLNVESGRQEVPGLVGFMGVMDYPPNVEGVTWFVEEVWPRVRAVHPEARFEIAGRGAGGKVRRLAAVHGVEVVGEVASAAAAVARFSVSVAPLRIARGLQNKVLEAMALARPVVLTSAAAAGIRIGSDKPPFCIADDPAAFAESVIRLLNDAPLRREMGERGQACARTNHCWNTELQRFAELVEGTDDRKLRRASARATAWHPSEQITPARPR